MRQDLQGRVALVTGGSGGLGSAIARLFAENGAAVLVGYDTGKGPAQALARNLTGPGHAAIEARVTDATSLAAMAAEVTRRHGRLDILVNCAGTTRFVAHADLDALDDALIDQIFAVNVRGVIATTRAVLPLLRASGAGLVVNISSIAGQTAMGSNIAYCASKAAVDNLTKSLGRALAPDVRVVSVSPGLIDTDFVRGLDFDWRQAQVDATPLGRLGTSADVAAAVLAAAVYLPFTTGTVIPVDGGRPLG